MLLSPTKAVIKAGESPVVLTLQHADPHARPEALGLLPGVSNYYLGNDPKKWRTDVPHFARVRYHDVYPGIDLIYYDNGKESSNTTSLFSPALIPYGQRIRSL